MPPLRATVYYRQLLLIRTRSASSGLVRSDAILPQPEWDSGPRGRNFCFPGKRRWLRVFPSSPACGAFGRWSVAARSMRTPTSASMSLPVNLGLFGGGLAIGAVGSYFASRPRGEPRAAQPVSATAAAVPVPAAPAATTGTPAVVAASAVPFFSRDTLKWTGTNPGPVSDLLENQSYVAGYDRRLRHPAWTAEHISAQTLLRGPQPPGAPPRGDRKKSAFHEDERVPLPFRAHLADYFRSGYDRGHMVPASDARINQQAMNETFALSNICPQVGEGFNRDYWAGVVRIVRFIAIESNTVD